jgi:hypothetical protein
METNLLLDMCYFLCKTKLRNAGVLGQHPQNLFNFCLFLPVFSHLIFVDGFLISFKGLRLLTNLGQ